MGERIMGESQSNFRQASVRESLLRSEESHFGDVFGPKGLRPDNS